MKNRLSGLIGSLLILTICLSCVSITDRTIAWHDYEKANELIVFVGTVTTTFTTYQPLHIISKRRIMQKAYSQLLVTAQYEYGAGVDVININIEGVYSGHNFWFITVGGGTSLLIPYFGPFIGIPILATSLLLQNIQKITVTGDVIRATDQVPLPIKRKLNTTETPMKNQGNSEVQSHESKQPPKQDSVPKISETSAGSRPSQQTNEKPAVLQPGELTILQQGLNRLPAVPIGGKNLKFEFSDVNWTAKINGKNFMNGDCIFEKIDNGYNITLKTNNVWSGAVEDVIDLFQMIGVPLGPAAGPLRAAAKLASMVAKWIPFNGSPIILEYNEGPPASLRLNSSQK